MMPSGSAEYRKEYRKEYRCITFEGISRDQAETVVALLYEEGFEGFEELPGSLRCFISDTEFQPGSADRIAAMFGISWQSVTIPETNWNAVWESGFQPVVIGSFAAVRASFHQPVPGVTHDLVITPQMSFGTGHHATTWLMIYRIASFDLRERSVFDFGTGTGVLAILACRMGAKTVTGLDNDRWSLENASENVANNGCSNIAIVGGDHLPDGMRCDLLLANINRHVLLDAMPAMAASLAADGRILLSGILEGDEPLISGAARAQGLENAWKGEKDGWICMEFHLRRSP